MREELTYFGWSVVAGVMVGLLGSILQVLHNRYKRPVWLGFLDLGYWYASAFGLFGLCFYRNSGVLRGYAAVGTMIGVWLGWGIKKTLHLAQKRVKMKKE